jgi:colanic acid biosynthesis protein WcaH
MAEISTDDYRVIVDNVPIVSVDLFVCHQGGLLLGKRTNEPAAGEWFIPGGTVLKGESLIEAVHRVSNEELGVDVVVDDRLGTYEHFYDAAATPSVDSKQYLATVFVVTPRSAEFVADDQHETLQVFDPPFPPLHNYVERYIREFRAAGYRFEGER